MSFFSSIKKKISFVNPSVSVVIPCHNNAYSLEMVLEALSNQSAPPEEIICVDDLSSNYQQQKILELTRSYKVHYLELPKDKFLIGRRSMARNWGSKIAQGDILLYLDGDTLIGPQYIENIHLIHSIDRKAMLYGKRYLISFDEQRKGIAHCLQIAKARSLEVALVEREQSLFSSTMITYLARILPMLPIWKTKLTYSIRWDNCLGNNLSVRKNHVEKIGYWDENFVGWGEEDMDLAYRLYISGCHPIIPEMGPIYSYHLCHKVDHQKNLLSLQRNVEYFVKKFPELHDVRTSHEVVYWYYKLYLQQS